LLLHLLSVHGSSNSLRAQLNTAPGFTANPTARAGKRVEAEHGRQTRSKHPEPNQSKYPSETTEDLQCFPPLFRARTYL
jgi:hypothetical protein